MSRIVGLPADFGVFWKKQKRQAEIESMSVSLQRVEFENTAAEYYRIQWKRGGGRNVTAKYICPSVSRQDCGRKVPLIVQFHDYHTLSRSWFHLTRYAGIGCAVLAVDEPGMAFVAEEMGGPIEGFRMTEAIRDGLAAIKLAKKFAEIDRKRMLLYGEGIGAAVALVCSALEDEITGCGALYPLGCGYRIVRENHWSGGFYRGIGEYFRLYDAKREYEDALLKKLSYIDAENFAPAITCKVLMGVGEQDDVSPPSAQFAAYDRIPGEKELKVYAKHGHELNNFFENSWLKFVTEVCSL